MDHALKMYVWDEFAPDYTDGLAVAVARNLKEARKTLTYMLREHGVSESDVRYIQTTEPKIFNPPCAVYVTGGA